METLDIMAIPLTKGFFALVDGEDYERINKHKWAVVGIKKYNLFYAQRYEDGRIILMHREILGLKHRDGMKTDHTNHNGIDNRKKNIRPCTHSQNMWNQRIKAKGYSFCKERRKWRARIGHNGKEIKLGSFDKEKDAAEAYQKAVIELRGDYLAALKK